MLALAAQPKFAQLPRPVGRRSALVCRAERPSVEPEQEEVSKKEPVLRGLPKPVVNDSSPSTAGPFSKFSIEREVLTGRLASFGMFSAICGEVITGKGPLGQLAIETGISMPVLSKILFAIIAFNAITALAPGSPTWSAQNQAAVEARGRKAAREFYDRKTLWPLDFSNWGVNKRNELVIGRIAMLLFLTASIFEMYTGTGPLVFANVLPGGVPLKEAPLYFPVIVAPFLIGAIGAGDSESPEEMSQ